MNRLRSALLLFFSLLLYPILQYQGRWCRNNIPRLPEASGQRSGQTAMDAPTTKIISLGESPVVGVGVDTMEEAISAQVAHILSKKQNINVAWQALGENGINARRLTKNIVPLLKDEDADIVFVALGVNDSTGFRLLPAWQQDIEELIGEIRNYLPEASIVFSGIPRLDTFPALPQPLRFIMGMQSRILDDALMELKIDNVHHCAMPKISGDEFFAVDGFHPNAKGCALWAEYVADYLRLLELNRND